MVDELGTNNKKSDKQQGDEKKERQKKISKKKLEQEKEKYKNGLFKKVLIFTFYYLACLLFSFWFLLDIWSNNFILLRLIGLNSEALDEPLIRTIGFTITGGFLGSILHHIRTMFYFYTHDLFDHRWFGKYLLAPWEGAGMAVVVLSLIRGGLVVFGNSQDTDVTSEGVFFAFGIGALVGFSMRDVVGWLHSIFQTMFPIKPHANPDDASQEDDTSETPTTEKPKKKINDNKLKKNTGKQS